MNKLLVVLTTVTCMIVANSWAQADVIPAVGTSEAHLKAVSNYFTASQPGAPGNQGLPGTPLVGFDTQPNIGDELRSIYRIDDLQLRGQGVYWNNTITSGDEITGLLYDLRVSRIDANGSIYFVAAGRNPLLASDDKNGDIGRFQGPSGGVLELYDDPNPNLNVFLNGGAGPNLWQPAGGPLRPNGITHADGYPTASDGSLWLSGVLLDLTLFGDMAAQPGEVFSLTRDGANIYNGLGYLNVFDGSASAFIAAGSQPKDGEPGAGLADVSLELSMRLGSNVWANPNWQSGSSDPLVFDVGEGSEVPEPATMLLVGLGASVLGVVRRRRS